MTQVQYGAALFVCASLIAQQASTVQGIARNRIEKAPFVELSSTVVDSAVEGSGNRYFAAANIDPEAVSFDEFEEDRYVALVRIDASRMGAARVHFNAFELPEGSELFVYSSQRGQSPVFVAGPYRNVGPLDGSDFWSDVVPGGTIVVELQVRGEVPAVLPFEIDLVEQFDKWSPRTDPTPEPVVERRISLFRGQEIEHEVHNGEAVLEGDILLDNVLELRQSGLSESGKDRSKSAIGQTSSYTRWPNGVIPYVIDSSVASPTNVLAAIAHWNTNLSGVISLVQRTNQSDYVKFVSGSGCYSNVGRTGGAQTIRLSSSCAIGNIIHEIGHTIGLYHEQSREDRNTWIKVRTENISSSSLYNFQQHQSSSDDLIYYAYSSIMHYPSTAFSTNGLPTIETIPAGIPIGQRTALDISDIAAVRKMYGKQNSTVSISTTPIGLTVTVDGTPVVTPAKFNWAAGSVHTITASSAIPSIAPSQYEFVRWTDGGARTHTIVVPSTGLAVSASYTLQHKLAASVSSSTAGVTAVSPASSDYYYPQSTKVNLVADAAPGYCFSKWSGLSSGTPSETLVSMTRSLAPTATFITGAITPAAKTATVSAAGGSFTMSTSATTGCGWMVKSSASWLTVSKKYATSSSPNFTYTVQANTTGVKRTAELTVDSTVVTITQNP